MSIVEIADIFLSKEGLVWVMDGKEVLYRDDDHLTHAGALRAKDRLEKAIAGYFQDKGI